MKKKPMLKIMVPVSFTGTVEVEIPGCHAAGPAGGVGPQGRPGPSAGDNGEPRRSRGRCLRGVPRWSSISDEADRRAGLGRVQDGRRERAVGHRKPLT